MPHFHVTLHSTAHVKAEFDISAPSREEAEDSALQSAESGNALWRYEGLAEDTPIEVVT